MAIQRASRRFRRCFSILVNELTKCLCCESYLVPLIDFGPMPLVNTYAVEQKYPLSVNRCVSCCHLQLNEFVDPEILYWDYAYCSGTGRTALDYFNDFARTAVHQYFPAAKTILDIGCNDGSQLDAFKALGLRTYGIDPAGNLQPISSARGHEVLVEFFEQREFTYGQTFDIIVAQNVIAHTPEPIRFLRRCEQIMHDTSRLFVATSQANMVVNGECDTVYHEHVSYFNAHSMMKLAERAGLTVLDIIMHDIHGTSYVFVLGKNGGQPHKRVANRIEWEFVVGMMAPPLYRWWKANTEEKRERIRQTITDYDQQGFYTVGCGAAAKGISMLNMAGVKLDIIADNTPTKWNKVASGMPIVPFIDIGNMTQRKILFVILAWNVAQEIRQNVLKMRDHPMDVFIETR